MLDIDMPEHVLRGLAARAARHGRTLDDEVRAVLTAAAATDSRHRGLVGTLRDRVLGEGGADLQIPPRTLARRADGPWEDPGD